MNLIKKMKEWKMIKTKNINARKNNEDNEDDNKKEEELEVEIAAVIDDMNIEMVKGTLNELDGGAQKGLWSLKKKINPKIKQTLPTGKKNIEGCVVTNPEELKELYLQTFLHRLRERPIKEGFEKLMEIKEELFMLILEAAKLNKRKPWNMNDLEAALASLKKEKLRDADGLINELFKLEVLGSDLKLSLLRLFNGIKEEGVFPDLLRKCNITAIHKKGSKMDIDNERGIFICSVLRSILMKMIYKDKYDIIDKNMSDSNIGARKKKNIRNHIFVLNSIIHDVLSSKDKKPIDIEVMDYRQMFDSENLRECIRHLFEADVNDDTLCILYEANKKSFIAVNTSNGLSRREETGENVMQGETLAPLISSLLVDSFGKECIKTDKHLYLYKDKVKVPPLAQTDDLITISECGYKTPKINAFMNSRTNMTKLYWGADKCKKMHVGKKKNDVLCNTLCVDGWKEVITIDSKTGRPKLSDKDVGKIKMKDVNAFKYLGSIIQSDGGHEEEIKARVGRGNGLVNEIMDILSDIVFGKYFFEVAKILRNSVLIGSMLSSAECWFGLTQQQVRNLEKVDEHLMERILEAPSWSSRTLLYICLNVIPIRFILMQKRLLFLQYILQEEKSSLIYKILMATLDNPTKKDFGDQIKTDLYSLDIDLSFESIETMSKYKFKRILKEKVSNAAFRYLRDEQKKQNKIKHIQILKFSLQDFLSAEGVYTTSLSKFIYNLYTESVDTKINQHWKYEDNLCICGIKAETQNHILNCIKLTNGNELLYINLTSNNLFDGDIDEKTNVAIMMKEKLSIRNKLLKEAEEKEKEKDAATLSSPCALDDAEAESVEP